MRVHGPHSGRSSLNSGNRFAKVDADSTGATILHSRGVEDVSRIGLAVFQVDVFEPVNQCGFFATLTANEVGVADEGEITVEPAGQFDTDSLWVRTTTVPARRSIPPRARASASTWCADRTRVQPTRRAEVAPHELWTPLTSIRGCLDLCAVGGFRRPGRRW